MPDASFSVIIPSKNVGNLKANIACIRAARETARVIVVDDCAPGELEANRAAGSDAFREVVVVQGIKPFIFARNINLGIAAAGTDHVILMNDDTCLRTPYGFSYMASMAKENERYGIISAGITDAVGNPEQIAQAGSRLRKARHHTLVFVCVFLLRSVLDKLEHRTPDGRRAWLDERYAAYGYDDDDACETVRQLGFELAVFDGCVVEHGVLPSSFRSALPGEAAHRADLRPNLEVFVEKWGSKPGQVVRAGGANA